MKSLLPPLCSQTNLPSFKTVKDLEAFHNSQTPSCHQLHRWQCSFCGHWHSWGVAPDPTGGSSGTGRHTKVDWDEKAVQKLMRRLYGDNYMETPLENNQ